MLSQPGGRLNPTLEQAQHHTATAFAAADAIPPLSWPTPALCNHIK